MLSPEVWNFSSPTPSLVHKTCNSVNDIFTTVKSQLFTHHVSITVPNTLNIPQELTNIIAEDSQYYRINNVPVKEFFNLEFVNIFIKNGDLTAVSINTYSDQDDHLAFTLNQKLILYLDRKSSQEIGIESANSILPKHKQTHSTFVLDTVTLTENKKLFSDINKKLCNVNLCFDVILMWEPNDINVCPSSISQYFSQKGYSVKSCHLKVQKNISYDIGVPVLDADSDHEGLLEWLGAFNLQCNLSDNDYISTFNCLEKTENLGQVFKISFTGLITQNRIQKLISEIQWSNSKGPSSWIGLVFNGFERSLMSSKNEKSFQMVGSCCQTLFLKRNAPSLLSSFIAS